MNKKVFISRTKEQSSELEKELKDVDIDLTSVSLIETKAIPFVLPSENPNWLFFFSSTAVGAFFSQVDRSLSTCKFGAVGPATARVLSSYVHVSFVGLGSDTRMIGRQFAASIGRDRVLVPQSDISRNPLEAILLPGQLDKVVCYTTSPEPEKIEFADLLIFSSPSNVQSFFLMNSISSKQKIIAFGPSTTKELADHGIMANRELHIIETREIVRAIMDLLCSSSTD
ncbi:MAG: uroporphyrinogen-III synthase [Flavobacteriales bacterium]|nr:uroporphyrinogen-III synthase [Flavobacteriales bacterium]